MKYKGRSFLQTALLSFVLALQPFQIFAQSKSSVPPTPQQTVKERDGQHDFDWELGSWKINISRLQHPLTGSTTWTELNGTVVCRKVWDGKANLAEIKADGPSGHLEFLALRLYNPQSRQWTNIFASSSGGTLSVPMFGEFKDGRGEFYDREPFNGRTILVRFIFIPLTPDSGRSEQAFSDDGGKTWETNWINTYTRSKEVASQPSMSIAQSSSANSQQALKEQRDGQHDFDFNIGTWKTQITRLQHPLTGSAEWVKWSGTVVVSKVWGGRANLEELKIDGPTGHIEGLTLRLYNPQSHQWTLSWASSSDGTVEQPLTGEFKNGRGVFFQQTQFNGRTIMVRHTYSNMTPDSHNFEQAFSDDGGTTWEPNWVAKLTREKP